MARRAVIAGALLFVVAASGCRQHGGCQQDTDCKGERVCNDGRCEDPASARTQPAPSRSTSPPSPADSRAEAQRPPEAPQDTRKGWDSSDACWRLLHENSLTEAEAACDRGLGLTNLDPKAKASLLYNKGLVYEKRGDRLRAAELMESSLSARPRDDDGATEVYNALLRVTRSPKGSFYCEKGVMCHPGETCCRDARAKCIPNGGSCEPGTSMGFHCDPGSHYPCPMSQVCRMAKGGHGPMTLTARCVNPADPIPDEPSHQFEEP